MESKKKNSRHKSQIKESRKLDDQKETAVDSKKRSKTFEIKNEQEESVVSCNKGIDRAKAENEMKTKVINLSSVEEPSKHVAEGQPREATNSSEDINSVDKASGIMHSQLENVQRKTAEENLDNSSEVKDQEKSVTVNEEKADPFKAENKEKEKVLVPNSAEEESNRYVVNQTSEAKHSSADTNFVKRIDETLHSQLENVDRKTAEENLDNSSEVKDQEKSVTANEDIADPFKAENKEKEKVLVPNSAEEEGNRYVVNQTSEAKHSSADTNFVERDDETLHSQLENVHRKTAEGNLDRPEYFQNYEYFKCSRIQ